MKKKTVQKRKTKIDRMATRLAKFAMTEILIDSIQNGELDETIYLDADFDDRAHDVRDVSILVMQKLNKALKQIK